MKRAALGFQMHSGWGVLVAVAGVADSLEIIDRKRITVMDAAMPGAKQPYHHAATLQLHESERHLENCSAVSERLAVAAIELVIEELNMREYRVDRSAILLGSGRPLPALGKILPAHPLIHTAEGEFFRNAVRKACERLQIPVEAIRERDLEERARAAFGGSASRVQQRIAAAGSSLGPPWTRDHKSAALAALIALSTAPRA